jgi:hypothetical protein
MEFIIDNSLKINKEELHERYDSAEFFLERHFDFNKARLLVTNIDGDLYHRNYLSYLEHCWDKHYGIIISPDIIWHIFLNELATHIKEVPEQYRKLFSTSDEKITIIVPYTGDVLDLNAVVNRLRELVPTNADLFLPEFTTTNAGSSFAFMAAFADAVSPYYNYMMYMCGISKIKITGTQQDWDIMLAHVNALKDYFPIILDYFERICSFVSTIMKQFTEPDTETMKNFFRLKGCGSGGQVKVEGWITNLYVDNKPKVAYPENFSSSISIVKYELIETKQKFELRCGLFSSFVSEDNYLIPNFGYVVHELETKESNNDENNRRSKERAV